MGRFSPTRLRSAGATFAVVLAAALAVAVPADASRRPPGPKQAAPAPRSVVRSAQVPFRWHTAKRAKGYDLRIARDRRFRTQMQTVHVRVVGAKLLLTPGRWFWKVRSTGKVNSRWSNIMQVDVRPKGDAYPPSRPTALRVTGVAADSVTVMFGASHDDGHVARYELLAGSTKVIARGTAAPLTALSLACGTTFTLRVRAVDGAGHVSATSPVAHARTRPCTDNSVPDAPGNVHAITVADTSVALAWDAAHDAGGTVTRYAVYRNGALLGQPHSTGFLATHLAPATPYAFTVVAIDGSGHRSAAGTLNLTTLAPLPATGPVYAYMLATTGASFEDLQRHYMQIAAVSPTYFHLGTDLAILGQDDALVTGWARLRGIDVEPRVESQDPAILHSLLSSDANRSDLIARISALVAENGYDGINIDFEAGAATDRPLLTAFASQLAQTLHAQGAKLTMAVAAKTSATLTGRAGFYDYPALAGIADRLFVMAWDLHWATSPAGPISDATWVGKIIQYVKTVSNAQRFTIGTQLYGFDWPLGAKATPYEWDEMTAMQTGLGATTLWDAVAQEPYFIYMDGSGVLHTAYFANAQSVQGRLGQARAAGLGVGVWRLGDEDHETWSIPSLTP
jgi:spore germination protein YaaH/chitodextrinase